LALATTQLGGLGGEGLGTTTIKVCAAGTVTGIVMFFLPVPAVFGGLGELAQVLLPTTAGFAVYIVLLRLLRVREWNELERAVRVRLRRASTRAG
jgi:hypothetical protein